MKKIIRSTRPIKDGNVDVDHVVEVPDGTTDFDLLDYLKDRIAGELSIKDDAPPDAVAEHILERNQNGKLMSKGKI